MSDVNFRPSDLIHFTLRNTYDVLADDLTSTSLVGGLEGDWGYLDMSYNSTRDRDTMHDQNTDLSVTGEHWFYKNDRIRIGYDLTKQFPGTSGSSEGRSTWPYKRFVVSYYNQCCGVSLSYEDNDLRQVQREREWTFIVSLKDVGNYLRYRERTTD
jgi:hypothetical protein